jgi:hypothetical protein
VNAFGRRAEAFAQARGLGRGEAKGGNHWLGFERKKFGAPCGGAEHAAGRGDVPAPPVMAWRHRKPDSAFNLGAEHESENEIAAAHASEFTEREQGRGHRGGRVNYGRHVGVAEVEHIGARGIEKGGGKRIEAFAAPDHRRLLAAGKSGERLQRRFDRALAAAGQRHGEEINERALGLMHDRRTERLPFSLDDEARQVSGYFQIVQHRGPREGPGASTDADKSARMARRRGEFEFRSRFGVNDAKRSHHRRCRRYRHAIAQDFARRLSASSGERHPQTRGPRHRR